MTTSMQDNKARALKLAELAKAGILADIDAGSIPRGIGCLGELNEYVELSKYIGAPEAWSGSNIYARVVLIVGAWLDARGDR